MYNSIDKNIFILFQINDSLFPIGSYSHSYGLETYIQKNLVKDMDSAYEYLKSNLRYNFLHTELLSIYLAYEAATKNNIKKLVTLDKILNCSKSPREVRLARQKLASRFIKTLISANIKYENNNFTEYTNMSNLPTHTVAYGVFCQAVGIDIKKAIEAFLYSYTSQTITNCVKTIPLSQTSGQQLLYKAQEIFEEILNILPNLTMDDLCISTPGFDVRCMQHETLYSRLYMS